MPRPFFTPGKDPVPIVQEAGGSQGLSGQVQKISTPPGFDPWTVQPVANRYTDYANGPTIFLNPQGKVSPFISPSDVLCEQPVFVHSVLSADTLLFPEQYSAHPVRP
jgi:hypothetical protein